MQGSEERGASPGRLKSALGVGVAAVASLVGACTPADSPAHAQTAATSGPNLLTGDQATFSGTTGGWVGINSKLTPGVASQRCKSRPRRCPGWRRGASCHRRANPPRRPRAKSTPGTPASRSAGRRRRSATPSSSSTRPARSRRRLGPGHHSHFVDVDHPARSGGDGPCHHRLGLPGGDLVQAVVGQSFLVESPVLNALTTPATAPSVVGPLHTSGNQIIQANGQPVTLRGFVMPGLEQRGTLAGTGVNKQAVIEAKAWGANFVRVPLGEQFWLSSNCDYAPSYVSTVDQVVQWITSLGMVALLDLHTNTVGGCEAGGPHNMADEAQAPTFWSEVASRYGDRPLPSTTLSSRSTCTTSPTTFPTPSGSTGARRPTTTADRATRPPACSSSTTWCVPPGPRTSCSSAAPTGPTHLRPA